METVFTNSAERNAGEIHRRFERDETFILRTVRSRIQPDTVFYVAYCGGMIDNEIVSRFIIAPLEASSGITEPREVMESVLSAHYPKLTKSFDEIEDGIAAGDTAVFTSGGAILLSTQGYGVRGSDEPDSEKVLSGPHEGFSEALLGNLSMLHRRLRTANLKIEFKTVGRQTRTRLAICYMDNLVKKPFLEELQKRLESIDIDGILDSNTVNELIRDNRWSPFHAFGTTERPDTAAAKMMEGRIVLLADGSPVALTLPFLFVENFQSSEDYYVSFLHASFARLLRIAAFMLTTLTPALYVSIVSFHYEILPGAMMLNMASEFRNTPFPAAFETFFMLIVFDVLRETGMRMSTNGGQALSIVGALIIGQAAVEAHIVSPQMIIVVAVTGITGLIVPKLDEACLYIRFFLLFCASGLGLFGFTAGAAVTLIHMQRLRSLGIAQIGGTRSDLKDTLIRAPFWKMTERPSKLSHNRRRMRIRHDDT